MNQTAQQFEPITTPQRPEFVAFIEANRDAIARAYRIPPELFKGMPIPDERKCYDELFDLIWNGRAPARLTFVPESA